MTIDLQGPWQLLDPENPLPPGTPDEARETLRSAGLLPAAPTVPGSQALLMASLLVPAEENADDDEAPIMATAVLVEGIPEAALPVTEAEPGVIEPVQATWRTKITWPRDVGEIELHHVRYTFPSPTGKAVYALEFSTPNLPIVVGMEAYFEAILASVEFVDQTEALDLANGPTAD